MSSQETVAPVTPFQELGLSDAVLRALQEIGYEKPSPIQAATIGPLLSGQDVLGQAQTGTGKTAAFALPVLTKITAGGSKPQALVLAPTRELAMQVAAAFKSFAKYIKGLNVLPIYGGQSYGPQLGALRRGVDVVVGTPGRVMDHIKRGTLALDGLDWLVLDEADEMLQMGFIEDIEWIFEQTPPQRQVALFSATMPKGIRKIAKQHLQAPQEVTIKSETTTAANIRQRYIITKGSDKPAALKRILAAEPIDAAIIFARTKRDTEQLAQQLQAAGYACAALNGDIVQAKRERTVGQLKNKQLDIIVATDVAARGLDVKRISHVINYDIPQDPETYVHRIGRTGRAGRSGDAILFITKKQRRALKGIERTTRQPVEAMELPSIDAVNAQREAQFMQQITDTLADAHQQETLAQYKKLLAAYQDIAPVDPLDLAAALASLVHGKRSLWLRPERIDKPQRSRKDRKDRDDDYDPSDTRQRKQYNDENLETFRIEAGYEHGASPKHIVGAIANEAGLDSQYIGRIDIRDDHSLVDLPKGMPKEIFQHLQTVWVANRQLRITLYADTQQPDWQPPAQEPSKGPRKTFKHKKGGKARRHKGRHKDRGPQGSKPSRRKKQGKKGQ